MAAKRKHFSAINLPNKQPEDNAFHQLVKLFLEAAAYLRCKAKPKAKYGKNCFFWTL